MVSGVVNPRENEEPSGENEDYKKKRRNYYWEIQQSPYDFPDLIGPMSRDEVFKMLIEEGYEIPFSIKRLRNVCE